MLKLLLSLAAVAPLLACAAGDGKAPAAITVYRHVGSLQCTGGGTPVPALERQLIDAGIRVLSASCGSDGRMHAAMCGLPDGAIGIFEIPASQKEAAAALKFTPLSLLPDANRFACAAPAPSRDATPSTIR